MGKFLTEFIGKKLRDSDIWEVYEPLKYEVSPGDIITVPKGFQTDLASIPPPFRNIFLKDGQWTDASVIHDFLYNKRGLAPAERKIARSRAECDAIFLAAMDDLGVPRHQRYPIYWGVRIGGWVFWNKK